MSLQVDQLISGWGMPSAEHVTVCSPLLALLFSLSSTTLAGTETKRQWWELIFPPDCRMEGKHASSGECESAVSLPQSRDEVGLITSVVVYF